MAERPSEWHPPPTSPSSGVGTLDSNGFAASSPTDEGLPEVVPGSTATTLRTKSDGKESKSPEVFTGDQSPEALRDQNGLRALEGSLEKNPKYPVVLDSAEKLPTTSGGDSDQAMNSPTGSLPWEPLSAIEGGDGFGKGKGKGEKDGEKRIWGMRQRVFVLLVIGTIIVVAAAIGGGVGGSIAARNARKDTISPTSVNTTLSPSGPITLNNATDYRSPPNVDGFAFQAFEGFNYTGRASDIVVQEGAADFPFQAWSWVWEQNDTGCCMTFCQGSNSTTNWHCTNEFRPNASGWFNHILVWCGGSSQNETYKYRCY